jgi:NADPH:quinone reductase-like Zn-dependent oxidoreductase
MRVWQVPASGGLNALTIADYPEPQVLPGQMLLKMRAWSLNYRDLLNVKHSASFKRPVLIPLSDGVGEVVAVGDGVTRVKVGDRVASTFFQNWIAGEFSDAVHPSALGGAIDGVLAEYVTLREDGVVHVPDHLSDEAAASLPCAAVTAWNALITQGHLKAGDTVLIQGTGGVSLFALQFAQMMGAQVIATSSNDEKLDRLRQLGAAALINYRTTPNWDEQVWQLTHKTGVDQVIEVGGAETLNRSLRSVRMGGQISMIGVLSGLSAEVSTATILQKSIRVQGIYVGSRETFEAMNRAIALHQMQPIIDKVFPFEAVQEALAYLESGTHFGKICIKHAD